MLHGPGGTVKARWKPLLRNVTSIFSRMQRCPNATLPKFNFARMQPCTRPLLAGPLQDPGWYLQRSTDWDVATCSIVTGCREGGARSGSKPCGRVIRITCSNTPINNTRNGPA
jgi:hypothetical protein